MNARRFFAAAALALASAACAGGSGPTLADQPEDGVVVLPDAPPTDTSVFIPAP